MTAAGPGPWLRQAGPDAPVELVTVDGVIATLTAADWLRLVEQGAAMFGPGLRRAVLDEMEG